MRNTLVLLLALLLSACGAMQTTPQPPPAPTSQAQEITRAQSFGLLKVGSISATERGSPDDVQRSIAATATAQGATYYQIVMLSETIVPGMWYATATLFNLSTAAGAH